MKTKSYAAPLLKFSLAFSFAFALLIFANVNVWAKPATVQNLKETDLEPYDIADITLTWDKVSSDQKIYYRLETSKDKITWDDRGSSDEPTKKLVHYTARLFFMHAYVPTQPLAIIFIRLIKVPVTLATGLMY